MTVVSVVIPVFNETEGLPSFHAALIDVLETLQCDFEVIYCNDGSTDETASLILGWHDSDKRVKLISLSRNFGKENALTAGLAVARGQAVITLDGDGQHPVSHIPQFVNAWKGGARVVIGLRTNDTSRQWLRRSASGLFYAVFNRLSQTPLIPGSTDFRLLDKRVVEAFRQLRETDRMTRLLVDWLGFKPHYIEFMAPERQHGRPGYSRGKLIHLALNSIVASSPRPLYAFGYLGMLITSISFICGAIVFVEQLLLDDPWHWNFTGTAMLSILLLFLVGVILLSQGLLSLYVSSIHAQSKQRPLYVIDYEASAGISEL